MTESVSPELNAPSIPASQNPAVARCYAMLHQIFDARDCEGLIHCAKVDLVALRACSAPTK